MVTARSVHHLSQIDQDALAFLRHRVGRFGLIAFAIGFGALVIRAGLAAGFGYFGDFLADHSVPPHVYATLVFGAVWVACTWGPLSRSFVVATEAIGVLLGSVFYILMGARIPLIANPMLITAYVLFMGFVARAVYVPSTPRRTAILGVLVGVPFLAVTYQLYLDAADDGPLRDLFDATGYDVTDAPPDDLALSQTLFSAMWWLFAVILCTAASQVIYGLRRRMRDVTKLGQYTLVEKLGEGGMGVVWAAKHAMLRRPTAVKLLHADRAGARSLARFEREVQRTAELTHPNTVTVFDYGRTPDGVFYYAMELLRGATLNDVVEVDGPQVEGRVVRILAQAASALQEAHEHGLIHRDVKPGNIMLVERGGELDVAKVLDFGLVKELDQATSTSLSQVNVVMGTPQYLAPEAIVAPESIDARSDLYALAAVGYFLLTGSHVFEGRNAVERLRAAPARRGGADRRAAWRAGARGARRAPARRPREGAREPAGERGRVPATAARAGRAGLDGGRGRGLVAHPSGGRRGATQGRTGRAPGDARRRPRLPLLSPARCSASAALLCPVVFCAAPVCSVLRSSAQLGASEVAKRSRAARCAASRSTSRRKRAGRSPSSQPRRASFAAARKSTPTRGLRSVPRSWQRSMPALFAARASSRASLRRATRTSPGAPRAASRKASMRPRSSFSRAGVMAGS